MELTRDLVEGRFVKRLNRFAALVEVAGQEVMVHVANSGRLEELLVPGYRMLLKPVPGDHRKCGYDLALVDEHRALDGLLPFRCDDWLSKTLATRRDSSSPASPPRSS